MLTSQLNANTGPRSADWSNPLGAVPYSKARSRRFWYQRVATWVGRRLGGQQPRPRTAPTTRGNAVDIADLTKQVHKRAQVENRAKISLSEETFVKIPKQQLPDHLLHPESPKLAPWEGFTASLLLYIAILTPVEVAFLPAPTQATQFFFIIGRFIDLVFVIDMVLQFFIMVPREDDPSKLETSMESIAVRYLNGCA